MLLLVHQDRFDLARLSRRDIEVFADVAIRSLDMRESRFNILEQFDRTLGRTIVTAEFLDGLLHPEAVGDVQVLP